MLNRQSHIVLHRTHRGFTLVELIVGIAIIGILLAVGVPGLSQFTIKSRVDGEISELHRIMLTARNTAINTGQYVTVCPLSGINCQTTNWHNTLTVFTNEANTLANAKVFQSTLVPASEFKIKVKNAAKGGDKVQSTKQAIVFSPTGKLASPGPVMIKYCPKGHPDLSRAVEISLSGRTYASDDIDNDNKDEDRSGNEITCS
ncbi:GspH/FimT family pseudopilin [Thalassotalea piscium]|uniref:Type II secretion system protein H n=1 Tax=Thalassotalea piscium TaxID=1230533 RepID=A0A7X0TVA5_9GAMM|nr:GspH/FimT family pseudopilin [Thalassotalea piscium]MBB6545146.1 type IV fimbrial biogenesis protein FimT/type IV fimbrial biogenesis protein FimU [Thalassotalea piscium]